MSADSDAKLDRHTTTGKPIVRRRQEMPSEAYVTAEEAAALLDRDDRLVLVLSYGWQTAAQCA